nr:uncharacterized protein CTRU02_00884 [Colletotrichum truncatum]KAF6800479.1 integral membrane protein [Colletotrichum truncatum]
MPSTLPAPGSSSQTALNDELLHSSNPSQHHSSQHPNSLKQNNTEYESLLPPLLDPENLTGTTSRNVSRTKGVAVIVALAGVNFLNTMGSGILIAALPRIASDVGLSENLALWPAAVYSLAAGCLLLIFGAVADVVGAKIMWLTGSFLYAVFTVAVGLARTGLQLVFFRTVLGISIAMCLPTAMSFITSTFPRGTWRNVAFSMNGIGFPLGYALGLVVGGIFVDTAGWRWGYYVMATINICLWAAAIWSLPSVHQQSEKKWTRRLTEDIDWIGALIISTALGLLLYVLAMATQSYTNLSNASNIVLLVAVVALLASFPVWMDVQVKKNRPALIPNHLWQNTSFTSICVSIFLSWAALNSIQYFIMLYFQEVQNVSALQSSLRFLPHIIVGTAVNTACAWLVAKVKVQTLSGVSAIITVVAPLLMATVDIDGDYWHAPFWALALSPVSADGESSLLRGSK